jgi:RNA polymerase subunit RPABC4/transcription elongation factor Spt4
MAMSNCKECGKQVSTTAKTCPNCGAPKPTEKKKLKLFLEQNKAQN